MLRLLRASSTATALKSPQQSFPRDHRTAHGSCHPHSKDTTTQMLLCLKPPNHQSMAEDPCAPLFPGPLDGPLPLLDQALDLALQLIPLAFPLELLVSGQAPHPLFDLAFGPVHEFAH